MTDNVQEGLDLIDKALKVNGEWRGTLPWLICVKGDLLLKQKFVSEAERCFLQSIDIARDQSCRWQELLASTRLARLLKSQGRPDEARVMLAGIYNWFTEGFDTPLLKDARAMLHELRT
jgi:hypothetical protein